MVRWEPGTPQRLRSAALELFARRGFEETTAVDIAAAAGVTERTFYRHFADKRDVLFDGQDRLTHAMLAGIAAMPADATPLEAVVAALMAGEALFSAERRPYSRQRQSVIESNPALLERERHKMASLAVHLAEALRARGTGEPQATLAADSGISIFGVAFAQWIREGETRSFGEIVEDVLDGFLDLARH